MSRAASGIAAVLFVFSARDVAAQAPDARSEAEALLRDGNARLREGGYESALDLYRRAYDRFPSPRIQVNMATALKALGRRAEAADLYALVLAAPASEVSEESRGEAQRILRELDIDLGRLRVLVAVEGARVLVDGREVGRSPLSTPVHVSPGEHQVSVEREGFRTATSRAVVSAGEVSDVSVILVEIAAEPSGPPPAPVETDRDDPSLVGRWWFWATLGVIVTGAAVGGVLIATGGS